MTFHAVPHAIGIVIEGVGPDGILRHVMHAKSAGVTPTGTELTDVANAVASWCNTSYKTVINSHITIQGVVAKDESVVDGPQVVGAGFLPVAGSYAGNPLPSGVTLAVSLRTAHGGRSYRGRFYAWPATVAQILADGSFDTGYANGVVTNLLTLISTLNTAGVPLAVKSNVLTTVTPITVAQLQDYYPDSQRRRLRGRGR